MACTNGNSTGTTPATMSTAGDNDTATSYTGDDRESLASGPLRPGVPHNTPAHTIAAAYSTIGDEDYMSQRASQIDLARMLTITSENYQPGIRDSFETTSTDTTETSEHHHEHSIWAAEAMDLMALALARLAVLAKDEHLGNPSKTVQEYYSERLAKAIKDGEIPVDARFLQQ